MNSVELTDREKAILRHVVQQFILTASPVGSRNISRKYNLGLSPATIRNIFRCLWAGVPDRPGEFPQTWDIGPMWII